MADDIMRELREPPAGWFIHAEYDATDHDGAHPFGQDEPPGPLKSFRVWLKTPEGHNGLLAFKRGTGGWQLAAAVSFDVELTTLLKEIAVRSMTWWKRYAILAITLEVNDMAEDIVARINPDLLARLQTAGIERIRDVLTAPLRKQRRRWTDPELKQIADWWLEAHNAGSRTPTRDVADRLNAGKKGNEALSIGRVRHLVTEARRKYFPDVVPKNSPPRAEHAPRSK